MFGCYRTGQANDPEVYVAAIAAVLAEYPESVIDYVTDPRTGLPKSCKFLPVVAEVAEACEQQMAPIRAAAARQRRLAQQMAERDEQISDPAVRERIAGGFSQLAAELRATGERLPPKEEDAA